MQESNKNRNIIIAIAVLAIIIFRLVNSNEGKNKSGTSNVTGRSHMVQCDLCDRMFDGSEAIVLEGNTLYRKCKFCSIKCARKYAEWNKIRLNN